MVRDLHIDYSESRDLILEQMLEYAAVVGVLKVRNFKSLESRVPPHPFLLLHCELAEIGQCGYLQEQIELHRSMRSSDWTIAWQSLHTADRLCPTVGAVVGSVTRLPMVLECYQRRLVSGGGEVIDLAVDDNAREMLMCW